MKELISHIINFPKDFIRDVIQNEKLRIFFVAFIFYFVAIIALIWRKKDLSLGNFTWGGGCVLLSLLIFYSQYPNNLSSRSLLIITLVVIWGIRLIIYLISRYKKGADPRFVDWQLTKGSFHVFAYIFFWVVICQGILMFIMAIPIMSANTGWKAEPLNKYDIFGTIIWLFGFCIESLADYELYHFMRNRSDQNTILDTGLWKYSRHPNYFGEILIWTGIAFIGLSGPQWIVCFIAPITITCVFLFYSIPLLERAMVNNPRYQEYKRKTAMLIPWLKP